MHFSYAVWKAFINTYIFDSLVTGDLTSVFNYKFNKTSALNSSGGSPGTGLGLKIKINK